MNENEKILTDKSEKWLPSLGLFQSQQICIVKTWVDIIESKMSYSESEPEFNLAINLVSDFDSDSASDSDSDYSSASMNLLIFAFFVLYLHSSKKTYG